MSLSPAERAALLEGVPLFSYLSDAERERVAGLLDEVAYQKGALICSEGEEGSSFFIIATGEVEVLGTAGRLLNRLGPGAFLGEMALLLESPRSATVRASRASRLLVLDRDVFEQHLQRNPKVIEHFARVLGQRLATSHHPERAARRGAAVAVVSEPGLLGRSTVATALAGLLRDLTGEEVLLVRTRSAESSGGSAGLSELAAASAEQLRKAVVVGREDVACLDVDLGSGDAQQATVDAWGRLMAKLEDVYPYVILDAPRRPEVAARALEQVSDEVVRIVERAMPGSSPARGEHRVVNLANPQCQAPPNVACDPYVISYEPGLAQADSFAALAYLRERHGSTALYSLRRLARKLLGRTLGMAVGGGAAFGISHVGVLEVFERHGIEVDLVAGTSMGSIVAAGFAAGIDPAEMRAIASRLGNVPTTLSALDFTLTRPGLIAGRRLVEIFSPLLGDVETFEQLERPCQLVATDIRTGERVALASGRVDAAFRASCSVPMLMAPVRHQGHVLVDGGVVDPVPSELVREMGADLCIAVNVVPPLREGVETVISRAYRQVNYLNPLSYLSDRGDLPNTIDVMMNSIQMLQHELGSFKSISADVLIVPDLSEYTWIEFYRAMELIERGAEAAEKALPEIRRVLAERGDPAH